MCIAILNKNGIIPEEYLFNSYSNNPDGIGIIWAERNKLYTFKTFNYDAFLGKYYEIRERITTPIAIHFRIATSGQVNMINCHPFIVNNRLAFIHNGIIPKLGNSELSDTYLYNEHRLKKLPTQFLRNPETLELISKEIGYSKLVFLDNTARYTLVNEHMGRWDKNNWYSNDTYKYNWNSEPDPYSFNYFDDNYFRDFYGSELPPYYDRLNEEEKTYLFDLIDLGYDTPPDIDTFLFDYDIYSATIEENDREMYTSEMLTEEERQAKDKRDNAEIKEIMDYYETLRYNH